MARHMDQVGLRKDAFGIHDVGVMEKQPVPIALSDFIALHTTKVIGEIR
jgi:hypothetical protein